ncbi:expressed unknown protein [Seminavis robusta]|uniref:Uncharacterized protein n=1 Tax=Seminavis robusta TaxID=568900 RepID=A0A9N8E6V7_9STRA|nr:expressed unknown protein [Seminavis robusta]|eukprot:Sro739_g195400.1 n/a (400) ;mRNA; f:24790-26105
MNVHIEDPYAAVDVMSISNRFDSGSSSKADQAPSCCFKVMRADLDLEEPAPSNCLKATTSINTSNSNSSSKLKKTRKTRRKTKSKKAQDQDCGAANTSEDLYSVASEPILVGTCTSTSSGGSRRRTMDFIPTTPKRAKSLEEGEKISTSKTFTQTSTINSTGTSRASQVPAPLRLPKRRQRRQIRWSQFDLVIQTGAPSHTITAPAPATATAVNEMDDSFSVLSSSQESIATANSANSTICSSSTGTNSSASRDPHISMRLLSSTDQGIQPTRKQPVNVRRKGRYSTAGRIQQQPNTNAVKHTHHDSSSHRRWSQVTPTHHVLCCPTCTNDLLVDLAPGWEAYNEDGYYPVQCPQCHEVASIQWPVHEQPYYHEQQVQEHQNHSAHSRLSMLCDEASMP